MILYLITVLQSLFCENIFGDLVAGNWEDVYGYPSQKRVRYEPCSAFRAYREAVFLSENYRKKKELNMNELC